MRQEILLRLFGQSPVEEIVTRANNRSEVIITWPHLQT